MSAEKEPRRLTKGQMRLAAVAVGAIVVGEVAVGAEILVHDKREGQATTVPSPRREQVGRPAPSVTADTLPETWIQYPKIDPKAICASGGEVPGNQASNPDNPDTWSHDIVIKPDLADVAAGAEAVGVLFGPGNSVAQEDQYPPEGRLFKPGRVRASNAITADRGNDATCFTVFSLNDGNITLVKTDVYLGAPPEGAPRV